MEKFTMSDIYFFQVNGYFFFFWNKIQSKILITLLHQLHYNLLHVYILVLNWRVDFSPKYVIGYTKSTVSFQKGYSIVNFLR